MKLDITSIIKNSGGIISIQVEEALEDLKTSLGTVSFISPVSFTGDVTNNNGILKLTGVAKVIYSTVCDRCAESIERELVVDINEDIIEKEKLMKRLLKSLMMTDSHLAATRWIWTEYWQIAY